MATGSHLEKWIEEDCSSLQDIFWHHHKLKSGSALRPSTRKWVPLGFSVSFFFFFLALLPNPRQNWVNMRVRLQWNLNWHQVEVYLWGGERRRHLRHSLVREKKRSVVSLNQSQNLFYRRVNHCVVWVTRLQTHQPLALKLWARCVNSAWTALQNHIHHVFCCG